MISNKVNTKFLYDLFNLLWESIFELLIKLMMLMNMRLWCMWIILVICF